MVNCHGARPVALILAAACRFATAAWPLVGAQNWLSRGGALPHTTLGYDCSVHTVLAFRSTVELFADGCGNTSAQPILTNACPFF